jgi:hypothetical protein
VAPGRIVSLVPSLTEALFARALPLLIPNPVERCRISPPHPCPLLPPVIPLIKRESPCPLEPPSGAKEGGGDDRVSSSILPDSVSAEDLPEFYALDIPAAREDGIHLVDGKLPTWYGPRMAGSLIQIYALLRY